MCIINASIVLHYTVAKDKTCCTEFFQNLCRETARCPVWTAEPLSRWWSVACRGPDVTCRGWAVVNRRCNGRQLERHCRALSSEWAPVMSGIHIHTRRAHINITSKTSVTAGMDDRGVARAKNFLIPTPHLWQKRVSLPVDGSKPPFSTK